MGNNTIPVLPHYISGSLRILGILILLSALGGCISRENKPDAGLPAQEISSGNLMLMQSAMTQNISANSSEPKPNQIRLILRPKELNRTGRFPVMLQIVNPKLNETVITVFKLGSGAEWSNQTSITHIASNNWIKNFSIKPGRNASYVQVFVQISENNTVVKKASWNITLGVPAERQR
ncbi:MAG: hypothetical protein OIN66_09135 [Candidatus Methanoperedens sp.]|nr:hypothetical protein [Candidatus Methanoperedens sp.]